MGANETRRWLVGSEVRRRTVVKRRHYPSSKCTPPADIRYTRRESLPTKIMDFPGKAYHVQLTFRNSRTSLYESARVRTQHETTTTHTHTHTLYTQGRYRTACTMVQSVVLWPLAAMAVTVTKWSAVGTSLGCW